MFKVVAAVVENTVLDIIIVVVEIEIECFVIVENVVIVVDDCC